MEVGLASSVENDLEDKSKVVKYGMHVLTPWNRASQRHRHSVPSDKPELCVKGEDDGIDWPKSVPVAALTPHIKKEGDGEESPSIGSCMGLNGVRGRAVCHLAEHLRHLADVDRRQRLELDTEESKYIRVVPSTMTSH